MKLSLKLKTSCLPRVKATSPLLISILRIFPEPRSLIRPKPAAHPDLKMARDHYLTLTVRDLPPGTTAQDVRHHIDRRHKNAQPVVGPLVKDPNRPSLYTVVTVRQDSDYQCRTLRDNLNLTKFFPQQPTTSVVESQIAVSDEFLGVTTLAEHENPQFE